jgi:hypothetical protein
MRRVPERRAEGGAGGGNWSLIDQRVPLGGGQALRVPERRSFFRIAHQNRVVVVEAGRTCSFPADIRTFARRAVKEGVVVVVPGQSQDLQSSASGIRCPHCGAATSSILKTSPTAGGIRRLRQCTLGCSFNTVERPADPEGVRVPNRAAVGNVRNLLELALAELTEPRTGGSATENANHA